MRFAAASKNNASNYATAGAHIINASSDIQQAIANRKPDYTGIAITAMDAALLEKQAALKAKTAVNTAGLKAVAGVKEAELTADSRVAAAQSMADAKINVAEMEADVQELEDRRRMAGKLSALGALAAKTAIKPKKVDRPEIITTDRSGQISEAQAALDEATAKYKDYLKSSGEEGEVAAASTPGAQSLTNGSNFFITGDTGRGTGPHLDARVWSHSAGGWVKPTGLYEQYITGPDGQSLSSYGMSDGYGPRTAPVPGASTYHPAEDWLIPSGTRLSVNLPQVEGYHGRKYDSGGGWMQGYRINDDLELHLLHGQRLSSDG